MLLELGERLAGRKLRLTVCAWARHEWDRLADARSRDAVVTAERFAEGRAASADLLEAFAGADAAWAEIPDYEGSRRAMRQSQRGQEATKRAAWAARRCAAPDLTPGSLSRFSQPKTKSYQAHMLRDLFGPLHFRPVAVDPRWRAWNGGAVLAVAATVDDGALGQIPVLADALEEAGCLDADILEHLRGPEPHVRGCWVVDLLLARACFPGAPASL